MSQLSSPEKKKTQASLLTSVSKAKDWVDELPLTNMGEVTRVLYQSLVATNQHPLSPAVRIDITEVLLPNINLALENLERHFSTRSFPLPERSQKVFDLKQALQQELAGSYQLAALDMLTRGNVSQKRLTIAIGRAISYMGRSLIDTYSVYVKAKPNVWHDVHHLYLLACENKIQDRTIPKPSRGGQYDAFSIESLYKLFNLIALGAPNSLRQGEIERLERFFATMVNTVPILDDVDHLSSDYAHIALLNSDEPAALMPVSEVLNSPTSRIFDVTRVENALRDLIKATNGLEFGTQQSQPILSQSLAKRLLKTFTVATSRKNKRFEREDVASLVFGLRDVASMVSNNNSLENLGGADDEDALYQEMAFGEGASSPWVELDQESIFENKDTDIQPWLVENSSSRGYGVSQKVLGPSSARVGEILGIRDPADDSQQWQVATIRWMDFYRGKGLCFGAEILSSTAQAISIDEISNRKATQRFPVAGLKLPIIDGVRDKPSLVLPAHMFRPEDILSIEDQEARLQITRIDDCLGSFAYCDFVVLDQSNDEEDDADFSGVWDYI